jgi:hypothetical protein
MARATRDNTHPVLFGEGVPYFSKLDRGHLLLEDPVVVQGRRALHLSTRSVADGSWLGRKRAAAGVGSSRVDVQGKAAPGPNVQA